MNDPKEFPKLDFSLPTIPRDKYKPPNIRIVERLVDVENKLAIIEAKINTLIVLVQRLGGTKSEAA